MCLLFVYILTIYIYEHPAFFSLFGKRGDYVKQLLALLSIQSNLTKFIL